MTVLAAQVIERLRLKESVSGRNMKVADNFVRGLDVLVSVSRLSPEKACVIVVYHDCKHQTS